MKKFLLLSAAVGLVLGASAQNARKYNPKNPVFAAPTKNYAVFEPSAMFQGPTKTQNNFVSAAGQSLMGNQPNAYGTSGDSRKQLVVNPDLNLVTFIHRTNAGFTPGSANSGAMALDFSIDKGLTFESNKGPIYWSSATAVDSSAGRYPSSGLYNPTGNTDITNARLLFYAPLLDASNGSWGGLAVGQTSINATPSATQFTYNSNPASSDYLNGTIAVPDHSATSIQGVSIILSACVDAAQDYTDTILVSRNAYSGSGNPLLTNTRVPINTYNNTLPALKVAFSPDGQTVWVAGIACLSYADADSAYHIFVMKSTDAGLTWSTPKGLYVNSSIPGNTNLFGIKDSLPTADTLTSQKLIFGTSFQLGLAVDNNGNPYINTDFGVQLQSDSSGQNANFTTYSFGSGRGNNAHYILYSADGGNTFLTKFVSYPLTFRGDFGVAADLPEDRRPGIATSRDGKIIMAVYFDTDTNISPDNLNPDAIGIMYNTTTSTWGNRLDSLTRGTVNESSMIQGTVGDYLFPTTDPNEFELPLAFVQLNGGSITGPNQLVYANGINFGVVNAINKLTANVNNLSISPNPSTGLFSISYSATSSSDATVEVFNVLGAKIATANATANAGNNVLNVDLTGNNAGIYVVRFTSNGTTTATRIIKN